MRQSKLETYLGHKVMVILTTGGVHSGYLEQSPEGYRLQGDHKLSKPFRCSHVTSVTRLAEKEEESCG